MHASSMTSGVGGTRVSRSKFCFLPHSLASRSYSVFRPQWGFHPSTTCHPPIHHPLFFCPPSHLPICLTFIHHPSIHYPSIHYPSIIYPIHPSVHPSIYHLPSIWPQSTMHLSIQPFTHLFRFHPPSSIHALSIQCVHLSVHPSTIHLSIHLPIQFSIHPPPTIHPSTICHPCVLAMLGAECTERGKPAPQSRSRRRGQE